MGEWIELTKYGFRVVRKLMRGKENRGENARRQHLTPGKAGHVTAGVRVSKPGLKVKQKEKDNETTSRLACRVSVGF